MSAVPAPEPAAGPEVVEPRPPGAGLVPLRLPVVGGVGTARTALAAFHRALVAVRLGHYNLVRLSSVVPPGTEVGIGRLGEGPALPARWREPRPADFVDGAHGDRLYCVYATHGTDVPGEEVWAGVGWALRVDGRGGYFVEHHGPSADAVRTEIVTSLADMTETEDAEFAPAQWLLEGAVCGGDAVCALVVVPYAAIGW